MSKNRIVQSHPHPKFRIAFITGNIILILGVALLIGIFAYQKIHPETAAQKPYPLGSSHQLNYVGKRDYGCLLICDADPASIYYYETDMSAQEVAAYFKKAKQYQPIEHDLSSTRIWLVRDNQDFVLSYYEDRADASQEGINFTAKHLVSLPSFNYEKAKNSL